jgi:hypothetical protein
VAKKIDKTLIKEYSTGVPLNIVYFFTNTGLLHRERKNITITVNGEEFNAYLERKKDGRHSLNLVGIKHLIELSTNHIRACALWFEKDATSTELFHIFIDSHVYGSSFNSRNTNKLSQALMTLIPYSVERIKITEQ